jgi:response regulator RpfG family c-di-GMP phosphodiesterase
MREKGGERLRRYGVSIQMASHYDRNVAVLVVEDEYLIRIDTTSYLESAGFIVFEAESATEAIRCLVPVSAGPKG